MAAYLNRCLCVKPVEKGQESLTTSLVIFLDILPVCVQLEASIEAASHIHVDLQGDVKGQQIHF